MSGPLRLVPSRLLSPLISRVGLRLSRVLQNVRRVGRMRSGGLCLEGRIRCGGAYSFMVLDIHDALLNFIWDGGSRTRLGMPSHKLH